MFKSSFENLMGGSHVSFKKLERRQYSDEEKEIDYENKRTLQESIYLLRRMRTGALQTFDVEKQQQLLEQAHQLSEQTAQIVLDLVARDEPVAVGAEFKEVLSELQEKYSEHESDSGHALPPQFSIQNLFMAAEDILARINEEVGSFKNPDHKLSLDELKRVLNQFLRGANNLTIQAVDAVFSADTRVGGILSGGAVYNEIVKKVIEKYADPQFKMNTFVVGVDKEKKKAIFEKSKTDDATKEVVLVDDVIDGGDTMLNALWVAGENFPNANIRSGVGMDYAGEFNKRKNEKHMSHLSTLFQDFADFSDSGKIEEAMRIYDEAALYAKQNGVELQAGWNKRKARIEARESADRPKATILSAEELLEQIYQGEKLPKDKRFLPSDKGGVFKYFSLKDIIGFSAYRGDDKFFPSVELDGKIVALSELEKDPRVAKNFWIKFISVDPDYEGRGCARAMIEKMFQFAKENKCSLEPSVYSDLGEDRLKKIVDRMAAETGVKIVGPHV